MATIQPHDESAVSSVVVYAFGGPVTVEIVRGDALRAQLDVLALKHAQQLHGVDKEVFKRLSNADAAQLPAPGAVWVTEGRGEIASSQIMFIGTPPLEFFDYAAIREFARRAVAATRTVGGGAEHLGMTLHGVGVGLDEAEALSAQLAGLLDAFRAKEASHSLSRISIIERDERRAARMSSVLARVMPKQVVDLLVERGAVPEPVASAVDYELSTAGWGSRSKKHIFVAMQFGPDTDDLYHYGISTAVKANGYLCERIDQAAFTGDILSQIRNRIDSASFVLAEVSTANPNVYLEIGYAWGRNVRTILLARDADQLRFDVQGQRCILYSNIRDLETKLTRELQHLSAAT